MARGFAARSETLVSIKAQKSRVQNIIICNLLVGKMFYSMVLRPSAVLALHDPNAISILFLSGWCESTIAKQHQG